MHYSSSYHSLCDNDFNHFWDGERYQQLRSHLRSLMKSSSSIPDAYSSVAHRHLLLMSVNMPMPLLPRDMWPNDFLDEYSSLSFLPWPVATTFRYVMDAVTKNKLFFPALRFGYALVRGVLVKTCFFVVTTTVVDGSSIVERKGVIDPLVTFKNLKPSCYFGCGVDERSLDDFINFRSCPLESFVKRLSYSSEEKPVSVDTLEARYFQQLLIAPRSFPRELLVFAKEQNFFVPEQDT